jgi:hypothetical protein
MWKSVQLVEIIFEFVGLSGIIGMLAFITWTKVALGGVLTVTGAFYPTFRGRPAAAEKGQAKVGWKGLSAQFAGTLRFAVIVAGIILIVGGIGDGHEKYVKIHDDEEPTLGSVAAGSTDANYENLSKTLQHMSPSQLDVLNRALEQRKTDEKLQELAGEQDKKKIP